MRNPERKPARKPKRTLKTDEPCVIQQTIYPTEENPPCALGTPGCLVNHKIKKPRQMTLLQQLKAANYAQDLKAWNARVLGKERKSHWTGD